MAKTYRITIEYTTTNVTEFGPDYWDWPELLDLDRREAKQVLMDWMQWVEQEPSNRDM